MFKISIPRINRRRVRTFEAVDPSQSIMVDQDTITILIPFEALEAMIADTDVAFVHGPTNGTAKVVIMAADPIQ